VLGINSKIPTVYVKFQILFNLHSHVLLFTKNRQFTKWVSEQLPSRQVPTGTLLTEQLPSRTTAYNAVTSWTTANRGTVSVKCSCSFRQLAVVPFLAKKG